MRSVEFTGSPATPEDMATHGGSATDAGLDWAFALAAPDHRLFARGLGRRLPPGPAATLGDRVRAFFAEPEAASATDRPGRRLLVGALPFDRGADDVLFQPRIVADRPWPARDRAAAPTRWAAAPRPSAEDYKTAVRRALAAIRASAQTSAQTGASLDKVVLSRSLDLTADREIDPFALLQDLKADALATRFLTPLGPGPAGTRRLVGASPELLVSRQGAAVVSHPLAGSARRSADLARDEAAASELLRSEKDHREHAVVVEAILDSLAPLCRTLSAPRQPALVSTGTMWHLGSRIEGRLRDPGQVSAAELAAALHPTPAVAGTPRDRAVELIGELEGYDRGFYAGAVGWANETGDGAWYVSLRCAELCGRQARLFAGAGIVEGSDPEAEAVETFGKFQTVLRALGIKEGDLTAAIAPTSDEGPR